MTVQHLQADRIIIATPPVAHMKMIFEPSLPTLRNQLIQRVPHGSVIKCFMFYKKPYWRNKGKCRNKHNWSELFEAISSSEFKIGLFFY